MGVHPAAVGGAGAGGVRIGYVHLRAVGPNDIAQFVEQYYPAYDRQGLIVNVRHNTGGNIDSWILGKLMRTALTNCRTPRLKATTRSWKRSSRTCRH